MAAERLGVPTGEVIFVDDNVTAVKTARDAGAVAYGVYDVSSDDYVDEMSATAVRYLKNFSELI